MNEVDFLRFLVENIVTKTENVEIEKRDDELGTLLILSVADEDKGLIIGKGGSTVNALRSVLRLYGMKHGKKVTLKVADDSSF